MIVSDDGEYLITTGCDGFLNVNEFKSNSVSNTYIINKKRIKITQKMGFDSPQTFEVDLNKNNILAISSGIMLKTIAINGNFDNFIPNNENLIIHKSDINRVQWVSNNIIVTSDLSNNIKIWNFNNKSCLYSFEADSQNSNSNFDNLKINYLSHFTSNNTTNKFFNCVFADSNGNLKFSDKIYFSKFESTTNKSTSAKEQILTTGETEMDQQIDDILNYLDEDQNKKKEKLDNVDNNKLLDLSDIEDENGEIKKPEEIAQGI
jgi:hypothetical protein